MQPYKNRIRNTLRTTALMLLCCVSFTAMAQGPGGPGDGSGGDPDQNVPIDGGVTALIGAAIVYGAQKMRQRKQTGEESSEEK